MTVCPGVGSRSPSHSRSENVTDLFIGIRSPQSGKVTTYLPLPGPVILVTVARTSPGGGLDCFMLLLLLLLIVKRDKPEWPSQTNSLIFYTFKTDLSTIQIF